MQVTELKVMRRELEGSRREIEALRKSSADGGVALKELSSTRRELESMKKQADVARADYAVRTLCIRDPGFCFSYTAYYRRYLC